MTNWDREFDVVVIGGGGGGLTAALVASLEGFETLLCERTDHLGGTTATSGGTIWVPGTTQSRRTAAPDSVEAARIYLNGEVRTYGPSELREAFFATGPEAIDYLEARTEVKFKANSPYPDYHPEQPGGALGGRALSPIEFDGRLLGRDFDLVRPPIPEFMILGGMMVPRGEIPDMVKPFSSLKSFRTATRNVLRYLGDRLRYRRGTRLVLGNALIGRLVYSLRKARATIETGTALVELVKEDGQVMGAIVECQGRSETVRARRGVVLATGGCAASPRWRSEVLPDIEIPHSLAFEGNNGDGLDAAIKAGGVVDKDHANPFFWMPASVMNWPRRVATYPHIRDRPKPGLVAVNSAGRRFVNEAASYHDFVMGMFRSHREVPSIPAHLICDRSFVRDYGLGVIHPVWQWIPYFLSRGYLISADSLPALAAKIRVDASALVAAVEEHNRFAKDGVDQAFGRGSSEQNRFNGDRTNKPNPNMRPIAKPPYFALAVYPAPIGSSIGLKTDVDGRVLNAAGGPIDGLYACGNDMSSIMRGFYPGPGITLGPAVVFAYRAAMHAVGRPVAAGIAVSEARASL